MNSKTYAQVLGQVQKSIKDLQVIESLLQKSPDAPYDQMGDVAHRHLLLQEQKGELTVKDSREIRRAMFGTKMRATANLFGTKNSGALFFRKAEFGSRVKPDQKVELTASGLARAKSYRLANGLT
jgi:hypothetical protein